MKTDVFPVMSRKEAYDSFRESRVREGGGRGANDE
jgi:hypothetical protein